MQIGILPRWSNRLKVFALPSPCPGCGAETAPFATSPVCSACWVGLESWGPACGRCGLRLPEPGTCGPCLLDPPRQEAAGHALAYAGLAREVLHLWKFGGAWYLAEPLADRMLPLLDILPSGFESAPLTFIPPHPWRLLRKDFHPPLLLARSLGWRSGRLVRPLLVKRALRRPQSSLPRERRLKNVRGTFTIRGGCAVPEAVVLIDDVATTGATLGEAVRVISRAGARRLAVLTLARTP